MSSVKIFSESFKSNYLGGNKACINMNRGLIKSVSNTFALFLRYILTGVWHTVKYTAHTAVVEEVLLF